MSARTCEFDSRSRHLASPPCGEVPEGRRGFPSSPNSGVNSRRNDESRWSVVRWTGVLGLAAIVAQVVGAIVGSAAGSPPPIDDATKILAFAKGSHFAHTTVLVLFLIGFSLFIGFIAGLRSIAIAAAAEQEWLATATFGVGIVIAVIGLVGNGLALATVAIAASSHADAAQVRLLFEIERVLGGAAWLVPAACYLGAAGSLGEASKILPRWLALVGWIGSVLVLIAALSAYGGSDPAAFWSANGSVTVLAFLPFWLWTLGASVVFVRQTAGVTGSGRSLE
jgi:hypothetical protein